MLNKKSVNLGKERQRKENVKIEKSSKSLKELLSMTKVKRMTPKRLRTFKGFEKVSKKQAREIIRTLEMYCRIVLHHMELKNKKL